MKVVVVVVVVVGLARLLKMAFSQSLSLFLAPAAAEE
jgi:hypothetical protein